MTKNSGLNISVLKRRGNNSGHRFEVDFFRNFFRLDVLFLVWDEDVASLVDLPAVLGDPLIDGVLVHQTQQLVEHFLPVEQKVGEHALFKGLNILIDRKIQKGVKIEILKS